MSILTHFPATPPIAESTKISFMGVANTGVLTRRGNLVIFDGNAYPSVAIPSGTIATIPEGYRPITSYIGYRVTVTGWGIVSATIATNGIITMHLNVVSDIGTVRTPPIPANALIRMHEVWFTA
jgi:hypothetical protein